MPDNTSLPPGSGGDLIATDALDTINGAPAPAGLKIQRVKVAFGGDSDAQDVSAAAPLPVIATGSATAAAQATGNASLTSIDGKLPALVNGKVPVSDPTALPLPAGAATAAAQNAAAAAQLGQDDRMDLMLYYLGAILEKMPIPDINDRLRVYIESSIGGAAALAINGVGNTVPTSSTGLQFMPYNLADVGAARLYDQVVFS